MSTMLTREWGGYGSGLAFTYTGNFTVVGTYILSLTYGYHKFGINVQRKTRSHARYGWCTWAI